MVRQVQDMIGRLIAVPECPRRIVSLVPSQTELLYDLGMEDEVVGITKFCVHPQGWFRTKARVGGTKNVNADRVAALQPDFIIANKEENEKAQIEALQDIAPVWVSDIRSLDDAVKMMNDIGVITGKAAAAEALSLAVLRGFAPLLRRPGKPGKVIYGIWRDPWMWAGGGTFIHDMLSRCGFENVLAGMPRYPEAGLDALPGLAPEVVLLSSEPYPFKEKHIAEIRTVLPQANILLVDGELFSWYGSRLLQAPPYFAALRQML